MGTAAEKEAVRAAAEAVVAETMQVGDMEKAAAEIEDAVQAMGWAAAEQVIMSAAQEVLQGTEDIHQNTTLGAEHHFEQNTTQI